MNQIYIWISVEVFIIAFDAAFKSLVIHVGRLAGEDVWMVSFQSDRWTVAHADTEATPVLQANFPKDKG